MEFVSLVHRKFKEHVEVLSGWDTGRAEWVKFVKESDRTACPMYAWDYKKAKSGSYPELEKAYYVATLMQGPGEECDIEYAWVLPENRDTAEIPEGWVKAEYEISGSERQGKAGPGTLTPAALKDEVYRVVAAGYIDGIPMLPGDRLICDRDVEAATVENFESVAVSWRFIQGEENYIPTDLFFVRAEGSSEWDLYTVSGKMPASVSVTLVENCDDVSNRVRMLELPIEYASEVSGDPDFALLPSTFPLDMEAEGKVIGLLAYGVDDVSMVVDARVDSDDSDFGFGRVGNSFWMTTSKTSKEVTHASFAVPVYIKYIETATGLEKEARRTMVVHGFNSHIEAEPYVKYIRNLASRVNTSEQVDIIGGNFTSDMTVRLGYGSEWEKVIDDKDLVFSEDGTMISFVMSPDFAMPAPGGEEPCAVYSLNVGYGNENGFYAMAGTGDARMALQNNVGLIRYKYDERNLAEMKKVSAGAAVTTNSPCFYESELEMVYDSTDTNGNPAQAGGAAGKYGKTMYVRIPANADCTKMMYVHAKVKYNKRLDYRRGTMTLDGIHLEDGDVVWLAGQLDGTDGLWVVREGDWDGLADVIGPGDGEEGTNPCELNPKRPLPVDDNVLVDLGVRVSDNVDVRCEEDVPVKIGTQAVCGTTVTPGDRVLLLNQSDGKNGVWEVTCADWIFRGAVNDNGSLDFDMSDEVLFQNNIDFCACRDGKNNPIYNIEYYYLNAGCYLAKAVRKVKIICSSTGSIVPNSKVVITDYSITIGADPALIVDTTMTPGDPVQEDCTKEKDTFELDRRVATTETASGCGPEGTPLKAPDCMDICDCPRFYTLPETFDGSALKNGYSLVFWQYGDGGWHLYAYICEKAGGTSVSYYVYHLHTCGIAVPDMVDENTDVYILDDRGLPTNRRTKDAWFVKHGGVLADGFGMYDEKWNFVIRLRTDDDEYAPIQSALDNLMNAFQDDTGAWAEVVGIYDDSGELKEKVVTPVFDADSLYQNWVLHGTNMGVSGQGTRILAHPHIMTDSETGEYVVVPAGMEHVYGFKFYDTPVDKERFCKIFNEKAGGCVCQETRSNLVTDQCYDADGNVVPCSDPASTGRAYIATDDGEILTVEGEAGL